MIINFHTFIIAVISGCIHILPLVHHLRTGRMMFAATVLVFGVFVAECSELHDVNGIISELTDVIQEMHAEFTDGIQNMKARVTEMETAMDLVMVENKRLKSKIDKIEEHQSKE